MSQKRLLIKSRSNNEQPSHTSPQLESQDQSPNFRALFFDIPHKQLSDSSDIKDPTIYSRKVSRLSQFSQINQKQKEQDSFEEEEPDQAGNSNIQTTKYKTKNWKSMNGLPKHADLNLIVKSFWNKLKSGTSIWNLELERIGLLKEKYIVDISEKLNRYDLILIRHILQIIKLISFLILPLNASDQNVNIILTSFVLLALIIRSIIQIIDDAIRIFYKNLILDFIYIIIFIIISYVEIDNISRLVLLLIAVALQIVAFIFNRKMFKNDYYLNFTMLMYFIYSMIYVNLLVCIWMILQVIYDAQPIYLDSLAWVINNLLPFQNIILQKQFDSNEVEQIYAIIVQLGSLIIEIYGLFQIGDFMTNYDSIELLKKYLQQHKVSRKMSSQAIQSIKQVIFKQSHSNFEKINYLISQLPFHISQPIQIHIKSKTIKQVQFFSTYFTESSINQIAEQAELTYYNPNDVIVQKRQQDNNIYIVLKGKVCEIDTVDQDKSQISIKSKYSVIGLEHLFLNGGHQLTIRSYGYSILLKISNNMLVEKIKKCQSDLETFHNLKYEIMFNQRYELLFNKCSICNQANHLTAECCKVHLIVNKQRMFQKYWHSVPVQRIKQERKLNHRINSYSNYQLVRTSARRFRRNYEILGSENEEMNQQYELYDETVENDEEYENEQQNGYSYKDLSNPSRLTNSNLEKQKSVEMVSGQTLRDLIQHNQTYEYEDMGQQQQFDVNRHQIVKQTIQTAGFQDDYLPESGITMPLQHKTITQNSNTYKSSSGQTYQSQKSQQRQPQKVHITAPPASDPNKLRPNQPKLTFSYDPLQQHQTQVEQYQSMYRPQYRSSTNYIVSNIQPSTSVTGLPIVSEESSSQLNIPFAANQLPFASAMSISSVGMASIDDNLRRDHSNTYTGYRRATQSKGTSNAISPGMSNAVSPGMTMQMMNNGGMSPGKTSEQKKSGSNSNSYLSSYRYQYHSDLENDEHDQLLKIQDSFDIDRAAIYGKFKVINNYDNVVNQLLLRLKLRKKNKKNKLQN